MFSEDQTHDNVIQEAIQERINNLKEEPLTNENQLSQYHQQIRKKKNEQVGNEEDLEKWNPGVYSLDWVKDENA